MLTVSADAHPFYSRFHKPGDEMRMPIILDESNTTTGSPATLRSRPDISGSMRARSMVRQRRCHRARRERQGHD